MNISGIFFHIFLVLFFFFQAFLDIDEALLNAEELKHEMGGSTAVVTLIKDNKLYCANAGDSRAIACVNGQVCQFMEFFSFLFFID